MAELRRVVHEVVPAAAEAISYAMPVFTRDTVRLLHSAPLPRELLVRLVPAMADRRG